MAVPAIGSGEEMKRWAFAVIRQVETAKSVCVNMMMLVCV
jgi:hypothetical protein